MWKYWKVAWLCIFKKNLEAIYIALNFVKLSLDFAFGLCLVEKIWKIHLRCIVLCVVELVWKIIYFAQEYTLFRWFENFKICIEYVKMSFNICGIVICIDEKFVAPICWTWLDDCFHYLYYKYYALSLHWCYVLSCP